MAFTFALTSPGIRQEKEHQPKAAFMRCSGTPGDDAVHPEWELSREQSAVPASFLCLSQRCGGDVAQGARDAAGVRARCRASACRGAEGSGQNRSVAGGTSASPASRYSRSGTSAQRRKLWSLLICPIAEPAQTRAERSRPKTLPDAHSANGGSIEATRALWPNTGGGCLIPCKIPKPHGQMRTMKVWAKQPAAIPSFKLSGL